MSNDAKNDFIREIVRQDVAHGSNGGQVVTRFPPEPNGYLHIGHCKAICVDFEVAAEFGGRCHLRMDDTNPDNESMEYVHGIQNDIRWLGFDWGPHMYYAADFFERMYELAEDLIREGKAYIDSCSEEEIRAQRGTVTEPGQLSPYRERSVEENLDLFRRMRAGEFEVGAHVLRAKIGMTSPNMKMRDPLLYRIKYAHHYRTLDKWCIYPMYDYAHPLEDALEGVTHSLCSLEFENNREVYDWVIDNTTGKNPANVRPRQYEFARLALGYTVMSKRFMKALVEGGHVDGWDDPRMPTLAGLRRRGFTPEAIRNFIHMVGVAKANSLVDVAKLEFCVRDDLNKRSKRVMAVVDPIKVTITNYPQGKTEQIEAAYFPPEMDDGSKRTLHFGRELWIERDDFALNPPKKYRRLTLGAEVRLRNAYTIRCDEAVTDQDGKVVELLCTYDPKTLGADPAGRNVQGVIHWVSFEHGIYAELRLYDRLFNVEVPGTKTGEYFDDLNPDALRVVPKAVVESSLAGAQPGERFQFERVGYFISDSKDFKPGALVFNRTVTLRDSWANKGVSEEVVPVKVAAKSPTETSKSPTEARDRLRSENPALAAAYNRFVNELGLGRDEADILSGSVDLVAFFEAAVAEADAKEVAKFVINELLAQKKGRSVNELLFDGAQLGRLIAMVNKGELSNSLAKRVFAHMVEHGGEAAAVVNALGLETMGEDKLLPVVEKVLADNSEAVLRYRAGKTGLIGFFVGQVMQATGGQADTAAAKELLKRALDG